MHKETIIYTDYDGNERKEDFYFNLNKAEVMELELCAKGGLQKKLQQIVADEDGQQIIEFLTDFILRTYGKKSADGKRFEKSKELAEAFQQTEAYSELFMKMVTNAEAAAQFLNGVVPQGMKVSDEELHKAIAE